MRKTWLLELDPVSSVPLTDSSTQGLVVGSDSDLSGFGNLLAVLFWEEITFTQEVGVIRTAGLFA